MKTYLAILLWIPLGLFAQQDEKAIRNVLARQLTCWNDGDLGCFMDGYWRSDRLVFIGKSGLTFGWDSILENYKKSYPTKEAMGQLSFDIKIVEPMSEDFWFVVGKWSLQRTEDDLSGHFSLVFRKLGADWVIVSDHSS